MGVFQDYAYYYNAFYKDKNYGKEAEQVNRILKMHGCDRGTLLNLGCGTGRHDIELSNLGYQCTGVDMSPLMIKIAKENAKEANNQISFLWLILENMSQSVNIMPLYRYSML